MKSKERVVIRLRKLTIASSNPVNFFILLEDFQKFREAVSSFWEVDLILGIMVIC